MGTHATCYDESTGKLTGSHRSRTSVLISPDGHYRAYAESDAVASRTANTGSKECENTSKLFVAEKSQNFRAVLVVRPLRERHGNGIDLVDWSPTGHRLLLTESAWECGSDVGETVVRTYDADSGNLSSRSSVDEGFHTYVGKSCAAIFHAVGFCPGGRVVATAEPFFDYGEDSPSQDSCVQKKGFWLIDFAIPAVRQLPDDYKVQHYGKVAP
jgi:dipeptidyl aminopeptidase/acylaminoacyl peptidase